MKLTGIHYILLTGVGLALVNTGVKFISRIPPHEILFFRALISLVITYGALRVAKLSPWGKNKPMLIARGVAGTFGLLLYFYTLQSMPFASAVTIQYLHPIITGVVAGFALKEAPTPVQWLLLGASFVGVILVRGFDARIETMDVVIGVISAILTSVSFTLIRALRNEDHALVVMFYLPLVSFFILGPYTVRHWVQPQGMEWAILLVVGGVTQISQYWLTRAYQLETAANISNFNNLGIVYAVVIGLVYFNEHVETLGIIGMALIGMSAIVSTKFRNEGKVKST